MAVPISNVVRRIVFAPSGVGPYAFTFEILAATDIEVYKGDTLLTLTTDYTVSINSNGTGSVTLVLTAGTDNITIVGARTIQRTTDFVTGGDLFANSLNEELDSLTIFTQQNAEAADRSIRAPVTDPTTIDMTLPVKADRAGKYLSFNSSTGDPEVVNNVVDVTAVAANAANINTVAGISANVTSVAGNASNINTVAGISGNVTTVAGIAANVTTVAGISADVTTVAADGTDIGAVAAISADVQALGPIAADITTVAGIDSDVTAVAADATDIGTVATNIANVNTVAGISADVTTVAGDSADIQTVAGIDSDITTVAGIAANVTTVAGISANVTTVAGISADVTTVATNVADITNFSDVYLGPAATNPATRNDSSALQAGDLYFNTADDAIKVYTGSAWVTAYITADGFVTVGDAQTITGVKTFDNGLATDTISEETSAAGVTVDGVLLKDSQVSTDVINEKTSATGVTIDGVLLKDSEVTTDVIKEKTSATGVTVDSVLLKDGMVVTDSSMNFRNRIINGGMDIAQRGTSFTSGANNDDAYVLDRFYILSDGNDAIDVTQTTTVPTGAKFSIGLDVETANKKFGIAQIIENANCFDAIGGAVTLSFQAKVSSTTKLDNIKCAIVAWSGTADSVTSNIISAWEAEGTNPTLIANATYENTPANLNVTTSFARYTVSAAVDTASTKNIIVFIWSDVTDTTAGDFLNITNVQLEVGSVATPFERRPFGTELSLCQRYYQSIDSGVLTGIGNGAATTASVVNEVFCPLFVPLRASPTMGSVSVTQVDADSISGATVTPTVNDFNANRQLVLNFTGLNADLLDNRACFIRINAPLTMNAEL